MLFCKSNRMKNLFIIVMSFVLSATAYAQKDYMAFEATIDNRNGDTIYIVKDNKLLKQFVINKEGFFKDTLKVSSGIYQLYDGVEVTSLFLKNGYDLKLKMNAKEFDESIVYTGKGAAENNFLAQHALYEEGVDYKAALASEENEFKKFLTKKRQADLDRLHNEKLDADLTSLHKQSIEAAFTDVQNYYDEAQKLKQLNNSPSPNFDYENHKGGKTKLSDLRGKFVYIDVWATWCAPCLAEIPHLKKVEEAFHGKNIEFVSISIDTQKNHEKWKKFVADKALGGTQLFADNDWNSEFIKAYGINGIPRFILIDPNGNIVEADADRPSSPALTATLNRIVK